MAIGFGSSLKEDWGCDCPQPTPINIDSVIAYIKRRSKVEQLERIEAALLETKDVLIYGKYAQYKAVIPRTVRNDGLYYTVVKTSCNSGFTLFDQVEHWFKINMIKGGYTKDFHYSSNDWPDGSFDIKFDKSEDAAKFESKFKHEVSRTIALDLD